MVLFDLVGKKMDWMGSFRRAILIFLNHAVNLFLFIGKCVFLADYFF